MACLASYAPVVLAATRSRRHEIDGAPTVSTLDAIHRLLAYAAAATTAVGIGWSLVLTVTGRVAGPAFEWFQAAVVSVFLVAGASGALLLVEGLRPAEGLHLLYAVVALAVIPLARSFLARASGRAASVLLLVAFVVLGAVTYRLFTTGEL